MLATSICAALMGLGWEVGTLIATFAMAGDLFSSFVKRRLHLASSSMTIGLDHIPKSLFPLLASRLLLPLSICFGSLADLLAQTTNVGFTLKSGHAGQRAQCSLSAKSRSLTTT